MKNNLAKKLITLLLVCLMILAVTACNKNNDKNDSNASAGNNAGDNPGGAVGDNNSGGGNTPAGGDNSGGNNGANNAGNANNASPAGGGGDGGENAPGGIVSARDTLTVATSQDSGTLLASQMMGAFMGVGRQYMEVLVDFEADGTPIWELATSIEEVSTSQWIIHCREGVTYSNGSKFDAHDVWFTFERYVNDPRGNFFLSCFDLPNSKIIDDYTIDLALSSYSVMQMGSLCQIFILDAETFDEDDFVLNPVGTGPYVVTEYVTNSHVYMKARDDYWGGKPYIENLHFKVVNEDSQIVNSIEAGALDIARLPDQEREYVKTLGNFDVREYYTVMAPTISFNMNEVSPMSNLDARLAICYAADRQAIINMAYFGYGNVSQYPVSEHVYDFEPRLANMHPTYSTGKNLDLAREYAEKAGLIGKDIVAMTNGGSAFVTTAEVLQANLKEIGVNLIISNYDGASYMTAMSDPTTHDLTCYMVSSPQCLAVGMLYEYVMWGAANYASWDRFDEYMELCRTAVAEPDQAKRSDMLFEMSQMFMDATPWYAIGDMTGSVAIASDLGGAIMIGSGMMLYKTFYWES